MYDHNADDSNRYDEETPKYHVFFHIGRVVQEPDNPLVREINYDGEDFVDRESLSFPLVENCANHHTITHKVG